MTPKLDTFTCKHCDAIIALIPRAAIVGRFTLKCQSCGVLLPIWPGPREPLKMTLDEQIVISYTDGVPVGI
jgi:hypothetical protein